MIATLGPVAIRFLSYLAVAAAVWAHGLSTGKHIEQRKAVAQLLEQTQAARAKEQQLSSEAAKLKEEKDAEINRISGELDAAIKRLRDRPARMPKTAAATCKGATGAQLSGPDAEFLTRLAARADKLKAELEQCQGWIEKVTK